MSRRREVNLPFAECPVPSGTRTRGYGCGCVVHDFALDIGPHLHFCRVHAAAFDLLDALQACQVRVFMAEGSSHTYKAAEAALITALGPRVPGEST